MQEAKEIGPHITKKEELDALYKNKKKSESKENTNDLLDNQEE